MEDRDAMKAKFEKLKVLLAPFEDDLELEDGKALADVSFADCEDGITSENEHELQIDCLGLLGLLGCELDEVIDVTEHDNCSFLHDMSMIFDPMSLSEWHWLESKNIAAFDGLYGYIGDDPMGNIGVIVMAGVNQGKIGMLDHAGPAFAFDAIANTKDGVDGDGKPRPFNSVEEASQQQLLEATEPHVMLVETDLLDLILERIEMYDELAEEAE